jgi:hypothetical protein
MGWTTEKSGFDFWLKQQTFIQIVEIGYEAQLGFCLITSGSPFHDGKAANE